MADKPDILVLWGDDIGITNPSCYSEGLMSDPLTFSVLATDIVQPGGNGAARPTDVGHHITTAGPCER